MASWYLYCCSGCVVAFFFAQARRLSQILVANCWWCELTPVFAGGSPCSLPLLLGNARYKQDTIPEYVSLLDSPCCLSSIKGHPQTSSLRLLTFKYRVVAVSALKTPDIL